MKWKTKSAAVCDLENRGEVKSLSSEDYFRYEINELRQKMFVLQEKVSGLQSDIDHLDAIVGKLLLAVAENNKNSAC